MTDNIAKLKMNDNIILQLGSKLYNQSFSWVIIRELMQNSIDAGARNIGVTFKGSRLTVTDDGCGLDENGLLNTFLTVGESDKLRTENTIGGFGIAKLAILSAKDWSIASHSKLLTKDILLNHELLDNDVCHNDTTAVEIQDPRLEYSTSTILDYLRLINCEANIYFNEQVVDRYPKDEVRIGPYIATVIHNVTGYIVVRCNGLPLFKDYVSSKNVSIIYDVTTTKLPYDDDYPFTVTREAWANGCEESTQYATFHTAIRKFYQDEEKAEEVRRVNLRKEGDYWLTGETILVDDFDEIYKAKLALFKKFINYLRSNSKSPIRTFEVGFTDIPCDAGYVYDEEHDQHFFFLNPVPKIDKVDIALSAAHEFTHVEYYSHNTEFVTALEKNIALVLDVLY